MKFAPNDGNGSTISLSPHRFDGLRMHNDAKTNHDHALPPRRSSRIQDSQAAAANAFMARVS
jgi:hypothetical protein